MSPWALGIFDGQIFFDFMVQMINWEYKWEVKQQWKQSLLAALLCKAQSQKKKKESI